MASLLAPSTREAARLSSALSSGCRAAQDRLTDDGIDRHRQPRSASDPNRSEEHTSELQSLMRTPYAVFYWTKKTEQKRPTINPVKQETNVSYNINAHINKKKKVQYR